jgi:hypothetical protein
MERLDGHSCQLSELTDLVMVAQCSPPKSSGLT